MRRIAGKKPMSSMRSASSSTSVRQAAENNQSAIEKIFRRPGRRHDHSRAFCEAGDLRPLRKKAAYDYRRRTQFGPRRASYWFGACIATFSVGTSTSAVIARSVLGEQLVHHRHDEG